jgi:hypothetical protein
MNEWKKRGPVAVAGSLFDLEVVRLCFSASDSFESVFEIPEHVLKSLEY